MVSERWYAVPVDGSGERGGLREDEETRAKTPALEEKDPRASMGGAVIQGNLLVNRVPQKPPSDKHVIKQAMGTQGTVLITKAARMKHLLCALSDLSP